MKTALVTGIGGQDGHYLAAQLLADGCRVLAAEAPGRPLAGRLDPAIEAAVERIPWRADDIAAMTAALRAHRPDAVFNLAAYSSGAGMDDDPPAILDANGTAVARLLEAIVAADPTIRLCQASSSEIFGLAPESPQSESTGFRPRSVYGAAKLAAHVIVDVYRRRHGVFACSAILYNHESPRRRPEFVTRRISLGVAAIATGRARELHLGSLDARRDWGFAGDAVSAMRAMLVHDRPDDYVVATGTSRSVRDFCDAAFARAGLDYRDHVRTTPDPRRGPEPLPLVGDATKLRSLGWAPSVDFEGLVAMMVDADLAAAGRGSR